MLEPDFGHADPYFIWHLVICNFTIIDMSVLLENIPLVKFIKTTSRPEWFIFDNLTHEFINDVILLYYFVDVILSI